MIFHYRIARMDNTPKVDKFRVSWDDTIFKHTHNKCH